MRTTLQFFKANTHFEVEEREKMGEEKYYCQNFSVSWRPTHTGPPCRGWRDVLDSTVKGYQQPPGGAARAIQRVQSAFHLLARALHTPTTFFNYKKTRTPLTPLDNFKKTEVKKPN